jgi:hypothetical protein
LQAFDEGNGVVHVDVKMLEDEVGGADGCTCSDKTIDSVGDAQTLGYLLCCFECWRAWNAIDRALGEAGAEAMWLTSGDESGECLKDVRCGPYEVGVVCVGERVHVGMRRRYLAQDSLCQFAK